MNQMSHFYRFLPAFFFAKTYGHINGEIDIFRKKFLTKRNVENSELFGNYQYAFLSRISTNYIKIDPSTLRVTNAFLPVLTRVLQKL